MEKGRRWQGALTAAMFWSCSGSLVLAQTTQPHKYPPNPLEIHSPDILLPAGVKRPLTPEEQQNLIRALNQLDAQAQARLNAQDKVAAFDIWNRELRLWQAFGPLIELQQLGRIGAIAWNQNYSREVQIILERLQTLQLQIESQPVDNLELEQALASAYEQLRAPQQELQVYQRIFDIQRRHHQGLAMQQDTLQKIAELYLSWFNYNQAADTYQQLLSLARQQGDRSSEETYLQQLAYIYEQANQPKQAVEVEQQLAEFYLNEKDLAQLPPLRLQIASDYAALGQLQQAFQNYQEAYASAWSLQQYYYAAEALQKLIAVYRSVGQTNAALTASRILLQANEKANNQYGLMNAYDQIGQIYLQRGDYAAAKVAFQNGLELAKQLGAQEQYFATQVAQASKRINPHH